MADESFDLVFELVAARHIFDLSDISVRTNLRDTIEFAARTLELPKTPISQGVLEVLLRIIEHQILTDYEVTKVLLYWDSLHQRADKIISQRLESLTGRKVPEVLLEHVINCLSGSVALRGKGKGNQNFYFRELVRRSSEQHERSELRCAVCGYHFRLGDAISNDRKRSITEEAAICAKSLHPGRELDKLKPVMSRANERMTAIEIDHIIPEEGMGWTDPDNLQLVCKFCNEGKMAYRRGLEPLSHFPVSNLVLERKHSRLSQIAMVSALIFFRSTCSYCGATVEDREMTAKASSVSSGRCGVNLPWNMDVVCYDCVMEEDQRLSAIS